MTEPLHHALPTWDANSVTSAENAGASVPTIASAPAVWKILEAFELSK